MLGRTTATLEPAPRRWLQRAWGCPDIHSRQKWMMLWPQLSRLPRRGLRVLDAGCGEGQWTLEMAARRLDWSVVGVDRNKQSVKRAEQSRRRLDLINAEFVESDFLDFKPSEKFDVVLSVSSAHYLVELGRGEDLFADFRSWLKPGGMLLLFAPRTKEEVPMMTGLPGFYLRDVFSFDELRSLCLEAGLRVELLVPCIGRLGTAAKQLACLTSRARILTPFAYPIEICLTLFDFMNISSKERSSSAWMLIARPNCAQIVRPAEAILEAEPQMMSNGR